MTVSISVMYCTVMLQISFLALFREMSKHVDKALGGPSPVILIEGKSNGIIVCLCTSQIKKQHAAIGSLKVIHLTVDNDIVYRGKYELMNSESSFIVLAETLLIGNTKSIHFNPFLLLAILTNR